MLSSGGYTFGIVRNSFSGAIKATNYFRKSAYTSGFLLFFLVLFTLCPLYLVPESTEAATKNPNPSTLTFAFTDNKNTASVSLTVTDENGNFATSTEAQKAAFSLSTDNATGYTLNLRTTGATTTLSDGTHSINTIASSGITADNFAVNTYGILPSKYNSSSNTTNYYPASTTGWTMDETSAANTTANTYTIGLGLKANYATAAGTYTTATTDNGNTGASLVLEYVANAVTYSINYYTNTSDTVTGMPSVNPQTGTVAQGTTSTSVNLASAPTRTGYTFKGWCLGSNASTSNITVKTDGTSDVCSTTTYDAGQSFGIDATKSPDTYYLFAMWQRNSITVGRQYRLQDTSGNYPSTYTADTNATVLYGDSYTYTIAATTSHQAASQTITNVTSTQTISLDVPRVHVTCNTQYRFEDQDGNFSSYTSDTATWAYYDGSCSYSRTETDYRGSSSAANGTAGSASASNVTSTQTLSISFYRNTYTLTVTAGTNTSGASGGGSKRWGQVVQVGVTKTANVTCTTYAAPSWSQGSASGTIGSTSNSGNTYYMNYTMPKSAATVTATSTATSVQQSITLSRSGGASGITIGGTTYTSSPVSLYCGTYNISGTYDTNYEFSSWAVSGSVSLGSSTTTAFNSITVSGTGTLTLTGKASCSTITFKTSNASSINFNGTNYSNNGSTCVANGTYWIYGNYASKYAFQSWANTAGSFANSSYQVTQYTVAGNATITLTGQSVTTTIQSITSSTCTTTAKPVYDTRDNEVYWIQQLADGKCWMLDNLRLGGTSTISLTSSSTNTGTSWTLPKSGTVCFYSSSCTGTDGSTTGTGYTVPAINTASKDTIPKSGSNLTVYGPGTGKIGVYYNYCAASAGNICVASNSNNGSADRDICPKGWKLPTTGSSNDSAGSYYYLYNTSYSANATNFRNALSTPLSGDFYYGSARERGSCGYFWSATRGDNTYMYRLDVGSSNLYPAFNNYRYYGNSVRCILK